MFFSQTCGVKRIIYRFFFHLIFSQTWPMLPHFSILETQLVSWSPGPVRHCPPSAAEGRYGHLPPRGAGSRFFRSFCLQIGVVISCVDQYLVWSGIPFFLVRIYILTEKNVEYVFQLFADLVLKGWELVGTCWDLELGTCWFKSNCWLGIHRFPMQLFLW